MKSSLLPIPANAWFITFDHVNPISRRTTWLSRLAISIIWYAGWTNIYECTVNTVYTWLPSSAAPGFIKVRWLWACHSRRAASKSSTPSPGRGSALVSSTLACRLDHNVRKCTKWKLAWCKACLVVQGLCLGTTSAHFSLYVLHLGFFQGLGCLNASTWLHQNIIFFSKSFQIKRSNGMFAYLLTRYFCS